MSAAVVLLVLDIIYIIITLSVKPFSQICQLGWITLIYIISNCYLDVQRGSDRITLISPTATWLYRVAATLDIRCRASDELHHITVVVVRRRMVRINFP